MPVNARELLIRNRVIGTDPLVDAILGNPEGSEAQLYLKASVLNKSALKKSYVESALLATDDIEEISELLEIPVEVIDIYSKIFYDTIGFDRLSRMELLDVPDSAEASMKMWGLSQGLSFLAWRLGKQVSVSPVEGLQDLFTTCVMKSKEAVFNSNSTEASKESTKYIKLSMDLARLIKAWVMDAGAARQDIELALQEIEPDFQGFESITRDNGTDAEVGEVSTESFSLEGFEGLNDLNGYGI